ncbi:MAG: RluA family pseudouridine synthase [Ruminiclostridium sp.]|nr:RluA family pseudouridine synthase [Ruminiclostridium sp.]
MRVLKYTADKSFERKKASALLTHIGCSREIIKMLKNGGLLINGSPAFTVQLLKENDIVELVFPDEVSSAVPRENDQVEILYYDEDLAVVNKPSYLPIHQSVGHYDDTLANHFAAIFPNSAFRAVTRLDRNTSGLCVVALNKFSAAVMCQNRPQKLYYAICQGVTPPVGSINVPIKRECESLMKRIVSPDGQAAETDYRTLKHYGNKSFLEISLKTGRTHQIRVHLAYIGYPLLGDDLYGGDCSEIKRHALHCGYIKLVHPVSKEIMEFECGIPKDMESCLNK